MTDRRQAPGDRAAGEGTDLWRIFAPLVVWALHFLISYGLVAIHCAKAGRDAPLGEARNWVIAATVAAILLIALISLRLWRVWARSQTDSDFEFEHNTPEERHRFLSHVALMLCALSVVGVIFVALPVLLIGSCR